MEKWVHAEGFIGGGLVVHGGIIADHIAAHAIRANHLDVTTGDIGEMGLSAAFANLNGTILANQIGARLIEAYHLNVTGRLSALGLEATLADIVDLNALRLNAAQINTGELNAARISGDVKNWDLLWSGSENLVAGTARSINLTSDNSGYHNIAASYSFTANSVTYFDLAFFPASGTRRNIIPNIFNEIQLIPSSGSVSVLLVRSRPQDSQTHITINIEEIYGVRNPS